jgi:hypothetical protein
MMWVINTWLLTIALCLHWIEEAEEGPVTVLERSNATF